MVARWQVPYEQEDYVLEGDVICMWRDLCQLLFSFKVLDYWMDL